MFTPPEQETKLEPVTVEQTKWDKGYISTYTDSRLPLAAIADSKNIILEQNATPRPRPSLVQYGQDLPGDCIGVGTFTKYVNGVPENWLIIMYVDGDNGKLAISKNGDSWTLVGGTYDNSNWANFTQADNKVFVTNGKDTLSYYDIEADSIVEYTELATPNQPTLSKSGLADSQYTYYYRITANNEVGETDASTEASIDVGLLRSQWDPDSDIVNVTWDAVTDADSYNVYMGNRADSTEYLATVVSTEFDDNGSQNPDPFRDAPDGNSTKGPTLTRMINKNSRLFGLGDVDNPSYLWFSGQGRNAGDFSPFNGGGWVAIDEGGETVPEAVRAFRDGAGNPALTILSRSTGGKGKLHHAEFASTTVGNTTITYLEVWEANGQSGTKAPLAVVEANNSLYYPSGETFKTTGSKANILNVLVTDSISQLIREDTAKLNQEYMHKAIGQSYRDKIYWALPVGTDQQTNNEIWVLDLSRNGIWILRWDVSADYLLVYEDEEDTNLLALVDNKFMRFTRTVATQDDGEPFETYLRSGSITFDKSGVTMAHIRDMRFKLLYPRGNIYLNVRGLTEDGGRRSLNKGLYEQELQASGWGQLIWSNADSERSYSDDVGVIEAYATVPSDVVPIEVDNTVNEIEWTVSTQDSDCDYFLASVHILGLKIPELYYGD